jgi:demethylmacrocin O-methyltransferase
MKIKEFILNCYSTEQRKNLRKKYGRFLIFFTKLIPFYGNLNLLAMVFGTDKNRQHNYTKYYSKHFRRFRFKKIKLLEIGVGGYEDPLTGGESLRMWKQYFPIGKIVALDIFDKSTLQENRIKIYQGSQIDPEILSRIAAENGEFDIIIDDGSHINSHIITTFQLLFPKLKEGGIYVIEDIQTSYWKEYGGCSPNLNSPETAINFFKTLVDGLNYTEYQMKDYRPSYYDLYITEIHFYHNLIFIYKNKNSE